MGKIPYSSPQLNPNPNPKTKPKKKQFTRHADESPAVTQTASDDAYSFNQMPLETISHTGFNLGECINFNVSSYSRRELKDLRKRFMSELDRMQTMNDQIEVGQLQSRSNGKVKKLSGSKRPMPLALVKDPKQDQKQVSQILDNGNLAGGFENGGGNLMKMCRQVLTKLMKHKNGWIFNKPVDAAALGLHDYHQIIKRPMDLGTVKSNFAKSLYTSPVDFAADVRLTFNNAMLYNPKTDGVHIMASELLDWFENMFRPISQKFLSSNGRDDRKNLVSDELQGSSWNDTPVPAPPEPKERVKKPKRSPLPPNSSSINPPISKQKERLQNKSSTSRPPPPPPPPPQPVNPQPLPSPVGTPSPAQSLQQQPMPEKPSGGSRGLTVKQPKPRAKDPNKREMSEEEKHKLGLGLQSLPQEKMPQLVQIIKKRNENLAQDGDEIELDIEALDTETLWELDRFVTNWKKLVSKTKRQALMGNYSATPTATVDDELPSSERVDMGNRLKNGREGAEEDVDIGDEMEIPETNFPSLELEVAKDEAGQVPPVPDPGHNGNKSNSSGSSSSSGSDSSSSSDSDSGSSSGSDSNANEAQS